MKEEASAPFSDSPCMGKVLDAEIDTVWESGNESFDWSEVQSSQGTP